MIHLKNEFKSTKHFHQSFGDNSFISVKARGERNFHHRGYDHDFVLETDETHCYFDVVEEIRFRGHCIIVKGVGYREWEYDRDDYHGSKRLFFKDRRVVDFLKNNLEEIFRLGGDEYDITVSKDGTVFKFNFKQRLKIPVYGVIDPVNGNLLSDVKSEAEAWMRPGCRFVHFNVYYFNGSIKDISPYYNRDGFNYYEVMCNVDYPEDDRCDYPIIATMDGTVPRDAGPKLTRFLLKMRETRPDTPHPGMMIGPNNSGSYEYENFYRGEERCIYMPTTGECMTMDEFFEHIRQDNCRKTICSLMEQLQVSGETYACSEFGFDGHDTGWYRSQLEMVRTIGADGSDAFVLKVFGDEREITGIDHEEGFRQVIEWVCNTMKIYILKEKWNGLKMKWA